MKNKKVVGLLLAGSMMLSSLTAFAKVDVEKDTYKFGDTVKITTDSKEYIQILNSNGEVIYQTASEKTANGWGYSFKLPKAANDMFKNNKTYTVKAGATGSITEDKFKIEDDSTVETDGDVSLKFKSSASLKAWTNDVVEFTNIKGLDNDDIVEVEFSVKLGSKDIELNDDYDARFNGDKNIGTVIEDVTVSTLKKNGLDFYFKKTGTYKINVIVRDASGKELVNKTGSVKVSSGGGGGSTTSSSGTSVGGTTWYPGISGSNLPSGMFVQLNPSQETEYGITKNVGYSGSMLTPTTFTVGVSVDGVARSSFQGYDPVYVRVPFKSTIADTSTIIVKDANGRIVPRSLYDSVNGKMLVNLRNISSSYSIENNPVSFGDVSHDWAVKSINALAAREIINGVGDGLYDPDRAVTRAEFTKMIVTMFDVFDPSASTTFADIAGSEWYAPYVATAQKLAITNGYPEDNTFRPNQIISREEMSAMLFRAADVLSVEVKAKLAKVDFADDANIQEYAKVPVYKMQQAQVLQGVGNNLFDPQGTCTRAQAAVAIYNMFVLSMNK